MLFRSNVLRAADLVLVPLIPTTLSLRTLDQLSEFVDDQNGPRPQVTGFFSMIDRRRKLHREVAATLPTQRGDIIAEGIPALSIVEQMAARREPVMAFAPQSVAARSYRALWDRTLGNRAQDGRAQGDRGSAALAAQSMPS